MAPKPKDAAAADEKNQATASYSACEKNKLTSAQEGTNSNHLVKSGDPGEIPYLSELGEQDCGNSRAS
jgi:hypothetical protein